MSRFILLCLILMVMPTARAAQPPIILAFGDSLSAGYGLASGQAWPALLDEKLKREGRPERVVNASVSGETTAGGRARLAEALGRVKPALVIIELGANDGLRGLPVPAMKDNLHAMVTACKAAGARVVLVGMRLPPNFGPSYVQAFRQAFSDVAKKEKTGFAPFLLEGFADRPEMFQPDGLHPVAAAQPLILETVWPEVAKGLGR